MSSYYIPEDITFKILSWLPAKSLLRFTVVSKVWESIISNPQFINTHVANSHKQPARLAMLTKEANSACMNTHKELIKLKLPPQCNGMTSFTHSCNGLICLGDSLVANMCVWNPLTKRLKIIQPPKIQYSERNITYNVGFGFDSISGDYKILRMVEYLHVSVIIAELYSFNDDCWKEIHVPETLRTVPSPILSTFSDCVQLKTGHVLYLDSYDELISFDLHNEVFDQVYSFPTSLCYRKKSHVLNFEDSVAMIFESIGDESILSLWTLNDDVCDCKESWSKKFNIEATWEINWVTLNFSIGQFVVRMYPGEYFLYDYNKKDIKKIISIANFAEAHTLVRYTESLVSLKGFKKEE